MAGNVAKVFLTFYVDGLLKPLGHEREVYAKAAGEVDEHRLGEGLLREPLLVACRLLAGALLHGEMWGIDNPVGSGP